MTSTTIAENELWASLQAGNIERVTFLLQEKGELALYLNGNTVSTTEELTASLDSASTIARLSVLEDVLPLALSSLAESYDKNGIVGDEGKYFALARELWKYLTDAEKSIPEMVCTFLYAGLKFDQPEFVRWILPIVSAHPAVDMSTLVSVRGYEFNQLRHSAIHYVARSGSIELFDMLVHACGGQSPLMLEAKWYESVTRDRLPVKVPTAQDTESGNTFSDTMLASSTSLPDLPDPPSLYVALKSKRLEFVRHVLGQLRPRDQAVVLRLTCVNGIMESDDAISAALLHSLCSQQSPDLATSTSASAAAAAASAASRENSKSASTISLVDTATLVDSVDISTALNEKVLKSSASGTHYPSTIIRQRSDTYNSGRWTHGARSSSALSSAGPSRRNSRTALVDPDVLLWAFGAGVGELPRFDAERESIDSSSSVTYSALHMCFFAVEDSAESSHMLPNPPGTRTEYARWALRVYGSFLLQPMSSMRWTGLGLGSSYAGSGSAAAAAQCTGWTALHSACAAGATDIVAAILVEDRSLLDSVAKKGISDAHITPAIVAVESTYWTQAFSCARTITGLLNSSQLEAQVYAPLRAAQVYSFRQAFAKALCQETGLSLRSIRQIQVVSAPAARTVTQTDSHSNNITDVEYDDIDSDESDGVEGSSFANSALDKKSASHRRSITLSRSRVQSSGSATNNDYMMRLRSRSDMSSTILDSAGSDGGVSEKGKEFATPERDADGTFQKVSYRQRDKQLSSNKRKSSSSQFQPPSPVIGATSPPRNGIQNVRELKNSSPTTSVAASTNVISTEKGLNTSTIHLPVMNSQNKKNNIIIPILPTSAGQKSHFEQTFTSNFVHSKANISLEQLEQEMEFVNSDSSYKNDNTRVQLQHFEHDYDFIDGMNLGLGISEEVSHTLTEPSLSVPVPTSAFTSTTSLPFHDEQLVLLSRMKQQLESLAQANANLEAQQRELLARDREREKRELEREAREKEREIQHQELLRLLKEKLSS